MHTVSNQAECYHCLVLSREEREAQTDFTRSHVATLSDMDIVTIYSNWERCSSPHANGVLLQPRPFAGDIVTFGTWVKRGRMLLSLQDQGAYGAEFRRFARLYLSVLQTSSSPYTLRWFISFWRGDDVLPGKNSSLVSIHVLPRPTSAEIPPLAWATPGLGRGTIVCAARSISFLGEELIQAGRLGRVESVDERVCNVQFSEHGFVVCLWSMLLIPVGRLPRKWLPPSTT